MVFGFTVGSEIALFCCWARHYIADNYDYGVFQASQDYLMMAELSNNESGSMAGEKFYVNAQGDKYVVTPQGGRCTLRSRPDYQRMLAAKCRNCKDVNVPEEGDDVPASPPIGGIIRGVEERFAGNGTTPLHKRDVRFSTAVIPTGDGLFRSVLMSNDRGINVSHPAEIVDQACRGLFPLGFLICNLFYWVYYLILANDEVS